MAPAPPTVAGNVVPIDKVLAAEVEIVNELLLFAALVHVVYPDENPVYELAGLILVDV